MATAAVVGVTTGVMKPLLSKLTKQLEEEYVKHKGVRKPIKFLRDELSAVSATLAMQSSSTLKPGNGGTSYGSWPMTWKTALMPSCLDFGNLADGTCLVSTSRFKKKKKKLWHFMFCVLRRLWECWVV